MDLSKYPLEKLLYFVAGVIPGFVALLMFQVAHPGSFNWFFSLGFLGYRTKVVLAVLAMFVVVKWLSWCDRWRHWGLWVQAAAVFRDCPLAGREVADSCIEVIGARRST
jgi:hypothetical protein